MPVDFKTPGVYIDETSNSFVSIEGAQTAIPAFIGYTEKALSSGSDLLFRPTKIVSLDQYREWFGYPPKEVSLSLTITDSGSGASASRTIRASSDRQRQSHFKMYYDLLMYFENGGGPCYIISIGLFSQTPPSDSDLQESDFKKGLEEAAKIAEPALLLFGDACGLEAASYYSVLEAALLQCAAQQDRFVIFGIKHISAVSDETLGSIQAFRQAKIVSSDVSILKFGAAYFPDLESTLKYTYRDEDVIITYIKNGRTLTGGSGSGAGTGGLSLAAILKPPADLEPDIRDGLKLVKPPVVKALIPLKKLLSDIRIARFPSVQVAGNAELYDALKNELDKLNVLVSPVGAVAGVYLRTDKSKGIWKAPANEALFSVRAPVLNISSQQEDLMNVDPVAGKSVNPIRYFTGKGVLVRGARTLAGNDHEWRYVPVCRFLMFVKQSITRGTGWVVFEPNNEATWIRLRSSIENFLQVQWRAGALAGVKPDQAFFVKVGLGVTMTLEDVHNGIVVAEYGLAVVRPAEFIISRIAYRIRQS